jgi:glycerol transport system ATP-binding protein
VFGVHPGDVTLDKSGIGSEVELAEISGSETFLHVRHADMRMVAHLSGVYAYALGDNVHIGIDGAKLFAFTAEGALAAAPASGG